MLSLRFAQVDRRLRQDWQQAIIPVISSFPSLCILRPQPAPFPYLPWDFVANKGFDLDLTCVRTARPGRHS
jgi:hypothetical protein